MASESKVNPASEYLWGEEEQSVEQIVQGPEKLDVAEGDGIRDSEEAAAEGRTVGPHRNGGAVDVDEFLGSSDQPVAEEKRLPSSKATVSEGLMKAIRSKPLWQEKLGDETVVKKYRKEAMEQGLPAEIFEETIKHLQFEAKNMGDSGRSMKASTFASTLSPMKPMTETSGIEMQDLIDSVAALQPKVPMMLKEPLEETDCGVWHVDNIVPRKLNDIIETRLDAIADLPEKDFHPNSNNQVQDLIHPSLFPYIEDVSPVIDKSALPPKSMKSPWSRPYKDSKYQWLPSQFHVDPSGSVQIKTYINNLEKGTNGELYRAIEILFGLFLPMFEKLLSPRNLRGRELQVIVKAANYIIQPHGNVYEGEWHVEGMSHEHIIASGIYYYSTSHWLQDGGLEFRRERDEWTDFPEWRRYSYHDCDSDSEDQELRNKLNQDFQHNIHLGAVPTVQNRLLVFSNELQHKVSKIVNDSDQVATRKILVFFLVDPDIEIVSTKHVPEQQREKKFPDLVSLTRMKHVPERQRGKKVPDFVSLIRMIAAKLLCGIWLPYETGDDNVSKACYGMTMAEAKSHRLKLMEERAVKVRDEIEIWEREYDFDSH